MNKFLLMLFSLCLGAACTQPPLTQRADVTVHLCAGAATRSLLPDEQLISDLNLFIYTEEGLLEERRYLSERFLQGGHAELSLRTSLLRGVTYTLAACANLGYELPPLTLEELTGYRYHMAFPDEYTHGMPMSLLTSRLIPEDEDISIDLELERAMARADLQLDRSGLDDDVKLVIERVQAGCCPASVSLFQENRVQGRDDLFTNGFFLDDSQSQPLNREGEGGKSGIVPVYLLENLRGEGPPEERLRPYIELWASYHSDSRHTPPGEHLTYRFYLGDDEENGAICRNTVYRYTVKLEGDGLGTEGWGLNKECLSEF